MNPKEIAGRKAAEFVEDGMVVGLGTGSTAYFAIEALGQRCAAGLQIEAVPTSQASAQQASDLGIPLVDLAQSPTIDLTIDGADEVDPDLNLIKGLGGALLREKIVAATTTIQLIIADESKVVDRLGTKAPLPIEVVPFGQSFVRRQLIAAGLEADLRRKDDSIFVTDNGNHILDCHFANGIDNAADTETWLNNLVGTVENGLFIGMTDKVIIGRPDGSCDILTTEKKA